LGSSTFSISIVKLEFFERFWGRRDFLCQKFRDRPHELVNVNRLLEETRRADERREWERCVDSLKDPMAEVYFYQYTQDAA
jgi:hypothetical protein